MHRDDRRMSRGIRRTVGGGHLPIERLEDRRLLSVGPDGFGYVASPTTPLNYDLEATNLDVVNLLPDEDDAVGQVGFPADSFNYYGETYNSIWVSDNGLIT